MLGICPPNRVTKLAAQVERLTQKIDCLTGEPNTDGMCAKLMQCPGLSYAVANLPA